MFDVRGQLRSVTTGGSSVGQFLYDSRGQRLRSQFHTLDNDQPADLISAQHSVYQGLKLLSQYDYTQTDSVN